jgi:sphinganine C4-monooxygenase
MKDLIEFVLQTAGLFAGVYLLLSFGVFYWMERSQRAYQRQISKVVKCVLWNLFVVTPFTVAVSFVILKELHTIKLQFKWMEILWPGIPMLLVAEIVFYSMHRLLHSNETWYKRYHQQHHQLVDTFAIGALYCSSTEMVLVNLNAVILPIILFGPSLNFIQYWICAACVLTLFAHSEALQTKIFKWTNGWFPNPKNSHPLHHHHMKVNFGTLGLCDVLLGTYWYGTSPSVSVCQN